MGGFEAFDGQKYLNLETFRKTGKGVRTPVWFAAGPGTSPAATLYVYSTGNSGKAKRIRRDGAVRIAPCNARGTTSGDWIDARAVIVGPEEFDRAMPLLNRKYWPWKQVFDLLVRFRPGATRIMIAIRSA